MLQKQEPPDYVWHFRLTHGPGEDPGSDPLVEMVRAQVAALLRCVVLTERGVDLKVTGFRFLGEPEVEHPVLTEGLAGPTVPPEVH